MAAETALRPILANGTAISAHRPNVHTMGDGPARWFRRNRRAGWAASGSAAPPKSLEMRCIRCRRERWTRRPPRPVLASSAIAVRGGIIDHVCAGFLMMSAAMDARSGSPGVAIHGRRHHRTPPPLDPNRNHPDSRWLPNDTSRNFIATFHRLRGS